MILRWFKRMFLEILFDEEVRKQIIEATAYQKYADEHPSPPKPQFARYRNTSR